MNNWIKWCSCGRMILRACQHKVGRCDICELEHAKTFKERLDKEHLDIKNDIKEFNS